MSKPSSVGIVGASGYSGETLVRILIAHPLARLAAVTSRSLAGTPLEQVIPDLRGATRGLRFDKSDPAELAARADVDTWFLALPHGVAAEYARAILAAGRRVIDLSADFRISDPARYQEFYGHAHPAPELLAEAAYVLPDSMRDGAWKSRRLIACPGCYPTSILTPLLPLLSKGVLDGTGIVINSLSGVSGAGRQAKEYYSYCERTESCVAYGIPKHRHLAEIEEQLARAAGRPVVAQFTPHLVPMRRGICTTIVVPAKGATLEQLYAAWQEAYGTNRFVCVLPTGTCPDTAHTIGTNRVDISCAHDPRTGNFVITSAEDNVVKGAGGQAVQIFNLIQGYAEDAGLR